MATVIRGLLSRDQVRTIAGRLFNAGFVDGTASGGPLGAGIKQNRQLAPGTPLYRELSELVLAALRANPAFNLAALPRRMLSPIFATYDRGHRYGPHIDAALMGPPPGLRTDLSITIFLNDPSAYEGGALELRSSFGTHSYKEPAGDAVLYPTHYEHQVTPVTSGRRMAIVTWIESMVADPARREIIADLAEATEGLVRAQAAPELIRRLEKTRLNLLRMWAVT